jgi:outer membrane protein assembly factor BamB
MRIVVSEPDTKSAPYQVIRATGYVAAVFSLVVCILLIANNLNLRRLDPVHSPALARLVEDLKATPRDAALREEIRELDLLTRRAFFTSQHFTHVGVALLVGGLAVMVTCWKTLNAYRATPPYPDSSDPKEDLAATAAWARRSITAVGLVLLGFALALALPWKSPLDAPESQAPVAARASTQAPGPAPVAPSPPTPAWPSLEERLAQWPGFRGAGGGLARAGKVPTTWEPETGAAWKSEVALPGMNSPVVWKDCVFLAGADAHSREVYCFNAATGELRWKPGVAPITDAAKKALQVAESTGYAASTMATDGTRAFVIFVDGELAAFALDGQPVWQRSLGLPENAYGHASSLVAFEDLLIVQLDRKTNSFVMGIDAATGKDRWKAPRQFGPSWASPQVIQGPRGALLVTAANPFLVVYDPRTGKELWRVECLKDAEVAVSPCYADGVIYVAGESTALTAIDVAKQQVLWKEDEVVPGICTPLVTNGLILFGLTDAAIVCLEAETGKELWRKETDEPIFASPVSVGENVYLIDRGGTVHVFKAQRSGYEAVGSPAVGEQVYATPAIVGNGLFVRGVKHAYRFGL